LRPNDAKALSMRGLILEAFKRARRKLGAAANSRRLVLEEIARLRFAAKA